MQPFSRFATLTLADKSLQMLNHPSSTLVRLLLIHLGEKKRGGGGGGGWPIRLQLFLTPFHSCHSRSSALQLKCGPAHQKRRSNDHSWLPLHQEPDKNMEILNMIFKICKLQL